jgi:hypothetical protein
MALELKIINPLESENWDEFALASRKSTIFHSAAWAKVLHDSYNYRPIYFAQINNSKFRNLIPLMEVSSLFTGRRGVSLPFSDVCNPIIEKNTKFEKILEQIINYGKTAGWKYIEFRIGHKPLDNIAVSKTYVNHILEFDGDEKQIYSRFRSSTKRNIKKAIKEGVESEICCTLDSMKAFYKLNCQTRKHHGLPPQPWYFFKKVFEHIISQKRGFVAHAIYDGKIVSSSVYFLFGRKAVYKWGASDREYNYLRANNLIMWKAIEWCIRKELKSFDLGRTSPDNEGLLQYKNGWRGKQETIHYYKYDFNKNAFVDEDSGLKSTFRFFYYMPTPLLKMIGYMLYRHAG